MKEGTLKVRQNHHESKIVEAHVTLNEDYLIIRPHNNHKRSLKKTQFADKTNEKLDQTDGSDMPAHTTTTNTPQRKVQIKRQPGGGLGISVKGGIEHGIPVLISKVFPGQAADQTHLLYPGDAIVAVNETIVEHMKHDEVVAELRKCGETVTLTVREFDGAKHVLRTASSQNNSTSSDQNVLTPTPGQTSNKENYSVKNNSTPKSPKVSNLKHRINDTPKSEDAHDGRIDDEVKISLLMARISTYQKGTDNQLLNEFVVHSSDNETKQALIFSSEDNQKTWLDEITKNIHTKNQAMQNELNTKCTSDQQVFFFGWCHERNVQLKPHWTTKFLVIQGHDLKVYNEPPKNFLESGSSASSSELSITLYESLFRSHTSPTKLLDRREHCFSVQYSTDEVIYCNVSTCDELEKWHELFHEATHKAVYSIQSKIYNCQWEGRECLLGIDFASGFTLHEKNSNNKLWSYKFSQLKSSSDDGKTNINFIFLNHKTQSLERQELSCEKAYQLLFCVHAFLEAKIALVDPEFLKKVASNQRSHEISYTEVHSTPKGAPKTPMAPRLVMEGKSPV